MEADSLPDILNQARARRNTKATALQAKAREVFFRPSISGVSKETDEEPDTAAEATYSKAASVTREI